jgi:hypothetical protein
VVGTSVAVGLGSNEEALVLVGRVVACDDTGSCWVDMAARVPATAVCTTCAGDSGNEVKVGWVICVWVIAIWSAFPNGVEEQDASKTVISTRLYSDFIFTSTPLLLSQH